MRWRVGICCQHNQPGSTQESYEGSGKVWKGFARNKLHFSRLRGWRALAKLDDFSTRASMSGSAECHRVSA